MSDANQQNTDEKTEENKRVDKAKEFENGDIQESGDPGRTPGSAEGDEETIDADIRQKEVEGKL